jgi:hypothetical protein
MQPGDIKFNDCGKIGCFCTHDNGCVKGWIDGKSITGYTEYHNRETKESRTIAREYDAVAFCPRCRGEQALIMRTAKTREQGLQKLREHTYES